jgi:hypothetical protein
MAIDKSNGGTIPKSEARVVCFYLWARMRSLLLGAPADFQLGLEQDRMSDSFCTDLVLPTINIGTSQKQPILICSRLPSGKLT